MQYILQGKYFKVAKEETVGTFITAQCMTCLPRQVQIQGHYTNASSFRAHLARIHPKEFQEYTNHRVSLEKDVLTQPRNMMPVSNKLTLSEQFELNVTKYVISAMIPLRSVENVHFRKIFEDLGVPNKIAMISRRKVREVMNTLYEKNVNEIKSELEDINFICTSADIWSGRRRSFCGITAHWITQDFQRKSAVLACCRFPGMHSSERIAEVLHNTHSNFGLSQGKVVATCTDNGSNCAKAFRIFGVQETCLEEQSPNTSMRYDEEDNLSGLKEAEEVEDWEIEEEVIQDDEEGGEWGEWKEDIESLNSSENATPSLMDFKLPRQIRCAAHSLRLCITSDLIRAINANTKLHHIHKEVLTKCNSLWNASSAEVVEKVLGHALSRPLETSWNSLYDALRELLRSKSKIMELVTHLGIKTSLHNNDFKYIEEHVKCTQPIAEAIDILQEEKYAFYGLVLPTLLTIRKKLQSLTSVDWVYCKTLNEALIISIETRFGDFFHFSDEEADNAAIAALSHPHFKNSWLTWVEDDSMKKILQKFEKLIAESMAKRQQYPTCSHNAFFNFDQVYSTTGDFTAKCSIQKLHFFQNHCTDWVMLNTYPDIKNIFLEYNTPLPSSGPVERLFSYATMTNCAKSKKRPDENFDKMIVLKANILDEGKG